MGFGNMLKDYLEYYKISQTDFAMRLGISTKHLNEILNDNAQMSLELMRLVSLLTGIDINLIFYVENKRMMQNYLEKKFKNEKEIKQFLNSFYIKELNKKGWLVLKDKTSLTQTSMDLLEFLNVKDFDVMNTYLNKKILYKKRDSANLKKIYLWLRYCDKIMLKQNVTDYNSNRLDSLLQDLKSIRNKKFDKDKLIKLFNSYGIYLVIEDALVGTKVRGCMMVKNANPAIYMTKYFKEKASFYFALYHEIGHIKSDYNKAKNKIIVEDLEFNNEDKCDTYALEQIIDKKTWNKILNDYDNKDKICLEENIPKSFLYSRLAYEGIIKYSSKEYNENKEII